MNQIAPRRILHIFGCMNRGGAEMRTLDVMRRIDRGRFQLEYCALSGQTGELDDPIRALGGEVHLCSLNLRFPWHFRRLLRDGRFDAVHSHVQMFSGLILGLAHQAGVPVRIAHFRSTSAGRKNTLRVRTQDRAMRSLLDRHATHILGNGEASLGLGWTPVWRRDPRCAVIHNGLDVGRPLPASTREDVRREFGCPPGAPLVIHVGRMDAAKNHTRLLDIWAQLVPRMPEARLLLVGRPSTEIAADILTKLAEHKLADRVVFAGSRDDVPRLLLAADVMIFPSVREGLPGAVLEACAVGTPVLASDLPGTREVAAHFQSVRCMGLCMSDELWAEAAVRLANDGQRAAWRHQARQALAKSVYSIDRCATAHAAAWSGESGETIRALYDGPPARGTRRATHEAAEGNLRAAG